MYRAVERRVLDHDPSSNGERPVTRREADALTASSLYHASTGSPASASHWRRSLADGSCLHLVIEGRRRRLHHDAFDPHANLLSLLMHMTHEARPEAAALAAVAWSTVKLLAG
ncbi:MAG TPA: hypothetical protein VH041_14660 [Caldimonas sp.]|jgi:hypothetical protein|nr:hypothetical protein [Caldimonas sp.]HEX4235534.1 hypothetical protein [Caldimonas sp.]